MNLQNKYMLLVAVLFVLIPVTMSSMSGKISATDWTYRHSVWIDQYIAGDWLPLFIYYPLFEFLMLPFVFFGFPMHLFQIVFALLSLAGILWMVYKLENEKMIVYTAILLASSIAYVEFSSALMPQALDYFLFPLAIVFYQKNDLKFTIPLILIFLMHGTGFIFVGIMFLHSILTKRRKFAKILFILFLIMFPIFYYYAFVSLQSEGVLWDIIAQREWEKQYLEPFWKFFAMSGFMTWILLVPASKRLLDVKFKLTDMQLLYVLWIVAFIPLLFFEMGIWRTISYMIVPLSLLVASVMTHDKMESEKMATQLA